MNTRRLTLAALTMMTFLSGCQTVVFDSRGCPSVPGYTKAEQKQLLAELDNAGPMTRRALRDYLDTRDKLRACARAKT